METAKPRKTGKTGRWGRLALAPWLAALVMGLAGLGGCAALEEEPPLTPIRERVKGVDRRMDWGLIYYQSWSRQKDPKYLNLSHQHLTAAVEGYYNLQMEMEYGYPDFYLVDRRRRKSCQYLSEMDDISVRYGYHLSRAWKQGCGGS